MKKSNDSQLTLDAIPRKVGELIADLNTENNEQAITITELEADLDELEAKKDDCLRQWFAKFEKLELETIERMRRLRAKIEKKDNEIARLKQSNHDMKVVMDVKERIISNVTGQALRKAIEETEIQLNDIKNK